MNYITVIRQTIADYDGSQQINMDMKVTIEWELSVWFENKNLKSTINSIVYYNKYNREYNEKGTIDKYKSM